MSKFYDDPTDPNSMIIEINTFKYTLPKKITMNGVCYEFLGAGSYNVAYKTVKPPYFVYKLPIDTEEITELPERAVRLWNEINFDTPFAQLMHNASGVVIGWTAPFVEGSKPTPDELSVAVIDIYQKTGRVVVDAIVLSNFIKMRNGKVVCIDISFALKLEKNLEDEKSEVSVTFWESAKEQYDSFFQKVEKNASCASVANIIKALLVLQQLRPDVRSLEKLKTNKGLVKKLANAYDSNKLKTVENLHSIFPINLDYFSKLNIFNAEHFGDEYKKILCRWYLEKGSLTPNDRLRFLKIQKLHLALEQYKKETSGIIEFFTTWQSKKSLDVFKRLKKIIENVNSNFSTHSIQVEEDIQDILSKEKLDPTTSRLGRILQQHGLMQHTYEATSSCLKISS